MSDIFTKHTPVTYRPARIALEQNEVGEIVAKADFEIYNIDGTIIDFDHPTVTLTASEQATFLSWFSGKLTEYETATGLTRRP